MLSSALHISPDLGDVACLLLGFRLSLLRVEGSLGHTRCWRVIWLSGFGDHLGLHLETPWLPNRTLWRVVVI